MDIIPDFSEEVSFEPIPVGVYKARVIGGELKKSKEKETPYVNWKLEVFGAEGDLAKANTKILFAMTMLAGKAAGRLKEFAKAAGKPLEQGKAFQIADYLGSEMQIGVSTRTYEGKDQNEVKAFSSL